MNTTRCGGLAAICALILCLGLAGSVLAADPGKKPDGFRGIAWGAEASSLKDMVLVETDGDFTDYDRKGDKKDLGGMPVAMVTYGFYKGQFYHAAIAYEGGTGFDAVQEHLVAKYGKPDSLVERADDAGRAYVLAAWNWPGYAYIGHRRYKDGSAGRVFYFYSPLVEASKAAAASSVATAAMDPQAPGAGTASAPQVKPRPGRDAKPEVSQAARQPEPAASLEKNPPPKPVTVVQNEPATAPAVQAPPRPQPPVAAAPGGGIAHIVEKGDMLSALAKRYGVPRSDILAANPGITPTNLKLGQTVIIPAGGKARAEASAAVPAAPEAVPEKPKTPEQAAAAGESGVVPGREAEPARADKPGPARTPGAEKKAAPGTHVIVQGDMISALANRYGVTEKAILKANPGLKPGNLKLGAVIRLPQGATAGAETASRPEPGAGAKPEATAPLDDAVQADTVPGREPQSQPATAPGLRPESRPEVATPVRTEPKPEPASVPKPQAAPAVAPKAASGVDAASAGKPAVETKPEAVSTPAAVSEGGQTAQAAQAARPREHVLEFDDTVSGLAKRYGVTTAAILSANPGLNPKKLKPGRKIKIP